MFNRDTPGQERFRPITLGHLDQVPCVLLLFDATKRASFDDLIEWLDALERNRFMEDGYFKPGTRDRKKYALLVGNDQQSSSREVTREEIVARAQKYHIGYMEVSVAQGIGVDEAIVEILSQFLGIGAATKTQMDQHVDVDHETKPENPSDDKKKKDTCAII